MLLSPITIVKHLTYWPRIRRWIVWNLQILIVSAIKICKQCLQTASADPHRGFVPGLHWPSGLQPQMKITATDAGCSVLWFTCDLYWESRADFANFLCSLIIGLIIHLHSVRCIIIIPSRLLSGVCLKRISLDTSAVSYTHLTLPTNREV